MGTTEITYAVSALTCVAATPDLEVYERAVTQADIRGQVCASTGGRGYRSFSWHGSDLSAQYGPRPSCIGGRPRPGATARRSSTTGASSFMTNVQLSKPRNGYCAMSGAG